MDLSRKISGMLLLVDAYWDFFLLFLDASWLHTAYWSALRLHYWTSNTTANRQTNDNHLAKICGWLQTCELFDNNVKRFPDKLDRFALDSKLILSVLLEFVQQINPGAVKSQIDGKSIANRISSAVNWTSPALANWNLKTESQNESRLVV